MENQDRNNFIVANLSELVKSTDVGDTFVVDLRTSRLINQEELECLILKNNGNSRATQVFTEGGGVYFLTNEDFDKLKSLKEKEVGGCYEGLFLNKEETANKIIQSAKSDQLIVDGSLELDETLTRSNVVSLVRNFLQDLKSGVIWWNPNKPSLPNNYIKRKAYRSNQFQSDGSLPLDVETKYLDELTEDIILLVDSPGSGKSTELTNFEQKLRHKFPNNRVILRINLSEVQKALSTVSSSESVPNVLIQLAPFLPLETFQIPEIQLFVLLDSFDEVCPKYQEKTMELLRILKASNSRFNIHIILTTRLHMKGAIESFFNLESWSLAPLEFKEQNNFIIAELGSTNGEVSKLQNIFSKSLKGLVSNPLMLSMMIEILKSNGTISTSELNIFELYSKFVDAKHKRHLVEKEGMRDEDNLTEVKVESMLTRNLPHYYHIALNELFWSKVEDEEGYSLPSSFTESIRSVAFELPLTGAIMTEYLSCGLLTGTSNKLRFKHLSFAEYFYAMLLLQPETPQEVRNTLFGTIYRGTNVLENVEVFIAAAISKKTLEPPLCLTARWLLFMQSDYIMLRNFERGRLIPLFLHEVLKAIVSNELKDLVESFCWLMKGPSRGVITMLFNWMNENKQLSRETLFDISHNVVTVPCTQNLPPAANCLIVAHALMFESERLFTQKEVRVALNSCTRLLFILISIPTEKTSKWDFVESHLGKLKFRELVQMADPWEWGLMMHDLQTVNKLWTTFSREELMSLIVVDETRKSDVVMWDPLQVLANFGTEFLSNLPHFRAKFVVQKLKGKTVFELNKWDDVDWYPFAFDYLWEDLHKEMKDGCKTVGPITVALREAIGSRSSWEVLWWLEYKIGSRWKCLCDPEGTVCGVMKWVVDGGDLWDTLTSFPVQLLPYIIHYGGKINHVAKVIQQNELTLKNEREGTWRFLLQSLVLSSHNSISGFFHPIHAFLDHNTNHVPPKWKNICEILAGAKEEELKALLFNPGFPSFVAEVSLGKICLELIGDTAESVNQMTCTEVVRDVFQFTRCKDLPEALDKLRNFPHKELKKVLASPDILHPLLPRLFSWNVRITDIIFCLRSLISLCFDIFCFDDMKNLGQLISLFSWYLKQVFSIELLATFERNIQLTPIFSQIESLMRRYVRDFNIKTGEEFISVISRKIGEVMGQDLQTIDLHLPCFGVFVGCYAAHLLRAFTVEGSEVRRILANILWDEIICSMENTANSVVLKGFYLHLAIFFGELECVERFASPGIVALKNTEGENALDIAQKLFGDDHPISSLLEKQLNLLREN